MSIGKKNTSEFGVDSGETNLIKLCLWKGIHEATEVSCLPFGVWQEKSFKNICRFYKFDKSDPLIFDNSNNNTINDKLHLIKTQRKE